MSSIQVIPSLGSKRKMRCCSRRMRSSLVTPCCRKRLFKVATLAESAPGNEVFLDETVYRVGAQAEAVHVAVEELSDDLLFTVGEEGKADLILRRILPRDGGYSARCRPRSTTPGSTVRTFKCLS